MRASAPCFLISTLPNHVPCLQLPRLESNANPSAQRVGCTSHFSHILMSIIRHFFSPPFLNILSHMKEASGHGFELNPE